MDSARKLFVFSADCILPPKKRTEDARAAEARRLRMVIPGGLLSDLSYMCATYSGLCHPGFDPAPPMILVTIIARVWRKDRVAPMVWAGCGLTAFALALLCHGR